MLEMSRYDAVWKALRNGHGALPNMAHPAPRPPVCRRREFSAVSSWATPVWRATALSSLKQLRRRDQVNAFGRRPFAECRRELLPAENDQACCHSVTAKSCLVVAQLVKYVDVHNAAPLARSEQRVAMAAGSDDVDLGLAVS